MPVRETTPKGEIDRFVNGVAERMRQALVYSLSYVGEQAVNAARKLANFKDRTGNLRSSIGYVIAEDGNIITESDFKPVKGGEEGARKGRELAARGYDVLDSAELLVQRLVLQMLRRLKLI